MNIQRPSRALVKNGFMDAVTRRGMHKVDPSKKEVVRPVRYNVRSSNGTISKYTVYDETAIVQYLKKIGNSYKVIGREFFGKYLHLFF